MLIEQALNQLLLRPWHTIHNSSGNKGERFKSSKFFFFSEKSNLLFNITKTTTLFDEANSL